MRVAHGTLHAIVSANTTPHPCIRRAIALWYLDWSETVADIGLVRPYAAALDVLIAGLPEGQREGTAASYWRAWNRATVVAASPCRARWKCSAG